ncbi:putative RNA-binding Zn-ribbon protein involved in translation (DUF1610 family) [Rhizobium azooxidifex]|uniref:Putative RNA-binding Zn-ribbon protein involved in translation (DUF1610 family) n=1 Tax=Mycoplana azooxidifex TaxID=1636188 RepID=A0A7W6D5R8_9HYPH|nr:hypothetical protein [Mycoplana azooxidifex]MBB3977271.1 putative RNA-binding Zn-ribbon protein involved in translation (DUF1610 family) [Mycoplana azooxidifex]
MQQFNNGKPYHGSPDVEGGKLRGATVDTDYFYFFCPKCPDDQIVRVLEHGIHAQQAVNPYNDQCHSVAKNGFTLAFRIHCDSCGFEDFIKISNTGWQGGRAVDMRNSSP